MKVTATIIPPKPVEPTVKDVTIVLTPREAFLMAMLLGSAGWSKLSEHINTYAANPTRKWPTEMIGKADQSEILSLSCMYDHIHDAITKR